MITSQDLNLETLKMTENPCFTDLKKVIRKFVM